MLGIMLLKGDGVTKNIQEAIKWFNLAAAQGNKAAKDILKELSRKE